MTFLRNIRRRSDFFKSFSFTDAVFKTIVQENFTNLPLTNNLMKSPLVKMSRLGKFKTGDGVLGFNAPFTFHPSLLTSNKSAFTLAEVLITLGIIGVVAAMTLPTLVQKKTNSEVEAKLQKIYSAMNQAVMLSEIDNGPKEYWPPSCTETTCEEYYNKYFLKYLKNVSHKEFNGYGGYNIAIYFTDGTLLIGKAGYDYYFFPNAKNFDEESFGVGTDDGGVIRNDCGTAYFAFRFAPSYKNDKFHYQKGFEPYRHSLEENTKEALTEGPYGCDLKSTAKVFCTAWIQLNGWKTPDDYPFTVK